MVTLTLAPRSFPVVFPYALGESCILLETLFSMTLYYTQIYAFPLRQSLSSCLLVFPFLSFFSTAIACHLILASPMVNVEEEEYVSVVLV